MNATMDPDLLKLVQQHVHDLKTDVETLTFEVQEDRERVSLALKEISSSLAELETRFEKVQSSLSQKMDVLHIDMEDVQQRVAQLEDRGK